MLALNLAFALQKVIFTTRGYVWPMKTLDPDYLAPWKVRMSLSRISFSLGSSLLLASVLALVLASLVKTRLKGATSRLAHLGKFNLNISSSSFVIRVNLLHPKPSLNLYGLLSSIWCFSILVNY